jgi:hypothetical protein
MFGTTVFFSTHIEQVRRLLQQRTVLARELKPMLERGNSPDTQEMSFRENEMLKDIQSFPQLCFSYQLCQGIRQLLMTARLFNILFLTTSASHKRTLNSGMVAKCCLNQFGDYSLDPVPEDLSPLSPLFAGPATVVPTAGPGQPRAVLSCNLRESEVIDLDGFESPHSECLLQQSKEPSKATEETE